MVFWVWFGSRLPHKQLEGIFHVGRCDQRALKFICEFRFFQVFSFFLMTPPRRVLPEPSCSSSAVMCGFCLSVWGTDRQFNLTCFFKQRRLCAGSSLLSCPVLRASAALVFFYSMFWVSRKEEVTASECHQEVWRVTHQLSWKVSSDKSLPVESTAYFMTLQNRWNLNLNCALAFKEKPVLMCVSCREFIWMEKKLFLIT